MIMFPKLQECLNDCLLRCKSAKDVESILNELRFEDHFFTEDQQLNILQNTPHLGEGKEAVIRDRITKVFCE